MWYARSITRGRSAVALALVIVLATCVDDGPVDPGMAGDLSDLAPVAAVIDGSTGYSSDFFFLPPLVNNPSISGTFNPFLLPTMRVCDMATLVDGACQESNLAAEFGEGSAAVGDKQYQISWDTDGPETVVLDPALFYRMEILVAGTVMGSIDLDPQDPDGPGQSTSGFHAFRVGETIPVKFWLSTQVLCEASGYVTECVTSAVVDESGATIALDDAGDRLSVQIIAGALPGDNAEPITVIIERLDPVLFAQQNDGEQCLPLFDAPQFGPCFRITTIPEGIILDHPALVSICIDPSVLAGINIPEGQEDQLQIVRFGSDGTTLEALPNVAGDCATQTASLFDVPERGFFRYAAMGANALASFLGPQPLAAHGDINLGGLTSSFSRFRFALPGLMTVTAGNGTILQAGDTKTVAAEITVLDYQGTPVQNAMVHFTADGGTLSLTDSITDAAGKASVTWNLTDEAPGTKTLTASATGLFDTDLPDHDVNYVFTARNVTVTATVVGPPAALNPTPTDPVTGTAGESAGIFTVTVKDAGGIAVAGADVTWTPSFGGAVTGGATTATDGTASTEWTLATTAGDNTLTVTVGTKTHTFKATGGAGPAVTPTSSGDGQSAYAGFAVSAPLLVTVVDAYGNPRAGDAVAWTVVSGDGSLSSVSAVTDPSGRASASWTLGRTAGANTGTAEVQGFTTTFTATGEVGPAVQPTGVGGAQTGVVGNQLSDALSVTVTDQFGNAREGDGVTWAGTGTFSATSTTTNAEGVAKVTWTLGTVAGAQTATATVGSFSVPFTATAGPDVASELTVSGDGQSAYVGDGLPTSLTVTVADRHGNLRSGDPVTWSTESGTIVGDGPTKVDGSASAIWTLGAFPGAVTATVESGGLRGTFTATALCFDGYGRARIDGTFDAAEWACAGSSGTFQANISGGNTPAEVYWMNDTDSLYIAVRVYQSSFDKVNSLLVDFDNDGVGGVAENDDAIGYDADGRTFFDRYVTKKCLNSSQSGCGADDALVNGAGAAANNGEWTTYELSHPLNGGDTKDIAVGTGDQLGFFLTLRVGNGAQGNTQWPGFRNFNYFQVVGF